MSNLGNKEVMAKNIQYYMDRQGIDRKKLSADLSISYTTLTDWLKAKTYPRIDKIEMLSNYFSISKADLVEEKQPATTLTKITDTSAKLNESGQKKVLKCAEDELKEQEKAKKKTSSTIHDEIKQTTNNIIHIPKTRADEKFKPVKYFGAVSAGTGEFIFGVEIADTVYLPEIKLPTTPFDYALRINGDSMEPAFKHRQYIFVQSFSDGGDIRDGMLAIVLYESQVYFKKLCIENDCVRLVSLNKKYPDIHVTNPDGFKVLGKVIV
ncbi:S24 family peptidase [Enterococcus faecalis]